MAEAIAALSLAANILQMVEYGGFFFTTAWKIYSSQADTHLAKDFDHLRYLTEDVEKILGSLEQNGLDTASAVGLRDRDRDLLALVAESRKITKEILDSLNKIGNPAAWKVKKHKAIQAAFKLTWKSDRIADLQTKLDRIRSQLTLHLVHSLRSDAAAPRETQDKILEKITQETDHLNNRIDQALDIGLGTACIGFITKKLGEERRGDVGESLRSAILDLIYQPEINSITTEPRAFVLPPARRQTLKEELLSKMAYPDIFAREESVAKAHEKTFQWIFEKEKQQGVPWASFCQWLETPDEKLYWITGKVGSGKSTLMRYVSQLPASNNCSGQPEDPGNQPWCLPFLERRAGRKPPLIASFYFWAVGSPMQRSKEGMLRALLHELLKQAEPEKIATIAPESWEALCLFDEDPRPYSEDLLQIMLSRALERLSANNQICIFIDGLDEFKGEHADLVEFFRDILCRYPIKLCISSRPWQLFEDAFHDKPSLRLEDLTLADITAYIKSQLHSDPAFALLRTKEPSFADDLVHNIAAKADGVFLWVNLVVASLQKGIKAGDRVSDLQWRLDQLPQDLEGLFGRILNILDPEYLGHAMQYFQLMEASLSVAPPNVIVFAYADEEDENFGVYFPLAPIDKTIFEVTTAVLKKRLNSRCMGLLEVTEQSEELEDVFVDASRSRVKYLHRTVRDYLERADVQETLRLRSRKGLGPHRSFDPHLRLCSAQLAFCKSSHMRIEPDDKYTPTVTVPDWGDKVVSETFRSLSSCLRHAAKVQDAGLPHMVRLLDSLKVVCSRVFKKYRCCNQSFVMFSRESYRLARGLDRYERAYERRDYLFTSLVIQHHVVEYMRAKVRHRPHRVALLSTKLMMKIKPLFQKRRVGLERGRQTVLEADRALHLDLQLHDAVVTTLPCPAIVQLLLERGANPQYTHKGGTLKEPSSYWELALAAYMIMYRENPSQEYVWEQVVRLMVRHGAPVRRVVVHKALRVVQGVRSGGEGWGEALCDTVETNLKLMKRVA